MNSNQHAHIGEIRGKLYKLSAKKISVYGL